MKSALKIVLFLFSFHFFWLIISFRRKKKKKSETSRTIPGKHLKVNQTSSQTKLRFVSLHSRLLIVICPAWIHMEAEKECLVMWHLALALFFSPAELVLNDLHSSLPAFCHWHVKSFKIFPRIEIFRTSPSFHYMCLIKLFLALKYLPDKHLSHLEFFTSPCKSFRTLQYYLQLQLMWGAFLFVFSPLSQSICPNEGSELLCTLNFIPYCSVIFKASSWWCALFSFVPNSKVQVRKG